MKLNHGLHLAYCTNVHRGEDWAETFDSLQRYTLAVRDRVCPNRPYAIGLRLSDRAARELSDPATLHDFQRWLEHHHCYVFTINGFPYGRFHGTRVKEQVYVPDWTTTERLEYTNRLFDLLDRLLPSGLEGSVSTLPGSFKEFIHNADQLKSIRGHVWRCVEHMARLCERTSRQFHLGLEPEPLGLFENSEETAQFFDRLRAEHRNDPRLDAHLGVNYDTCHFAVEFEEAGHALRRLQQHGIRISKIHLSAALKVRPTEAARTRLAEFADDVYLHQVIARGDDGLLAHYRDLDLALAHPTAHTLHPGAEWRIHFHIPLHSQPEGEFGTTHDHILGVLNVLQANPALCSHLEMETYTWEVMPQSLKNQSVVDQLVREYQWTLARLAERGLADTAPPSA
jgi:hypothetical protein